MGPQRSNEGQQRGRRTFSAGSTVFGTPLEALAPLNDLRSYCRNQLLESHYVILNFPTYLF